jgi:8-oxo-dGTP diphosphatase
MYKIEFEKFFSYSFSLDCVIFGFKEDAIHVLLIKRAAEPFINNWAIPGDLIYPDEDLPEAASRILSELTKLNGIELHQTLTFGNPNRHPQGRVITCAFMALVNMDSINAVASSWVEEVKWVPVEKVGQLAFDHNLIINSTFDILKQKLRTEPVCFDMLPRKFTLNEMQKLYESAFNTEIDKGNFRKKIKMIPLIKHNEKQEFVKHRPASLYSFDYDKFQKLLKEDLYSFKM